MQDINVDLEELLDYTEAMNKVEGLFQPVFDDFTDNRRKATELYTQNLSKIRKIISKRNEEYMQALQRFNEMLNYINSNSSVSYGSGELLKPYANARDKAKKKLDEAQDIEKQIEKSYQKYIEYLSETVRAVDSSYDSLMDTISKGNSKINEYAIFIREGTNLSNQMGNIFIPNAEVAIPTSAIGGLVASALSSSINSPIGTNINNHVNSPNYYANDIQHEEIEGLQSTNQEWHNDGEYSTFNTPEETGKTLDSNQGKYDNFYGTCGIVSCVNVLRLAGVIITEKIAVMFAKSHIGKNGLPLCVTGGAPSDNGGTSPESRKAILEAFGVKSSLVPATIDNIFENVSAGKGVIVSVYAERLYGKVVKDDNLHAITITSVKYKNGVPYSVIVCDSNGYPSKEYSVEHFQRALTGRALNVTDKVIR